jgi:hypothetical protein
MSISSDPPAPVTRYLNRVKYHQKRHLFEANLALFGAKLGDN